MCYVRTNRARPFIAPSSEPQWGLTLTEPLRVYFNSSTIRSRSGGKKLSIPSTSRNPAARRGALSTNSEKHKIQMDAIVWRVSWINTLFITFLVNPLKKSSSVTWFSQRITQPSSIYTSDFLNKRRDTVTCSFAFNEDFVFKILILSSLSNMEVSRGEWSRLKTVFIIMSLDWFKTYSTLEQMRLVSCTWLFPNFAIFLFTAIVNTNLDKSVSPPDKLFQMTQAVHFQCPLHHVHSPFQMKSDQQQHWLNQRDDYMDAGERCKSDDFVSCPYLLCSKWCVMASLFHDPSPPSLHCDRACSQYVEWTCCNCLYPMPIVSWFRAEGLCLWFRLVQLRNAWRLSLSRCQTPRKTKQWTQQPRSTTTNLSAVIHLRTGFCQCIFILLHIVGLQIFLRWKFSAVV